jgi:hypothetical protein
MSAMTEEVEVSERQLDRGLPEGEIPFFDAWNVGAYEGQHGKEYKNHAGIYVLFEFAQETIV